MKKNFIDGGFHKGLFWDKYKREVDNYYAFEPDPRMFSYAGPIHNYSRSVVDFARFMYSNNAIWIEDISKEFNICQRQDEQGSSLLEGGFASGIKHSVNCIDFDRWVRQTINREDYNILKLDIEGAEYDVLCRMIDNGTIRYFNEVMVEFHRKKNFDNSESWDSQGERISAFFKANPDIDFKYLK